VQVLPFFTMKDFHEEYCAATMDDYGADNVAGMTTFKEVYNDISRNGVVCRMMKGKGSFATCGICNSAAILLANKSRTLTKPERVVVMQYR